MYACVCAVSERELSCLCCLMDWGVWLICAKTMAVQASVIILPTIGEALDIPSSRQQWIVSAYNLTFGCFLVRQASPCCLECGLMGVVAVGQAGGCVWTAADFYMGIGVFHAHVDCAAVYQE